MQNGRFPSKRKNSLRLWRPQLRKNFDGDASVRYSFLCMCVYVEYKMAITAKQTFLLFGPVCPFIYGFDRPKRSPYLHVMRKGGKRKSCSMGGDELSSTSTTYTYTQRVSLTFWFIGRLIHLCALGFAALYLSALANSYSIKRPYCKSWCSTIRKTNFISTLVDSLCRHQNNS